MTATQAHHTALNLRLRIANLIEVVNSPCTACGDPPKVRLRALSQVVKIDINELCDFLDDLTQLKLFESQT
jgi:hypothetical protein